MAVRQESSPALARTHLLEAFGGPSEPLPMAEFDDDDDEFEDAEEEQAEATMNLHQAFEDCEVAIQKFFNNDICGALHIMQPWKSTSLYHSLGTAIFEFIPAMLTFDQNQIARALAAIKITISICNRHRRSNQSLVETLGTMIKRPNYASYSDLEAHSELCYAEALLLQAAMTIMEGEDLTGFIKGTIKVRNCYNSYKECARILVKKPWESEASRQNFHSGVRLGVATFNVMISLLPPRIVSLLEFVGFTGNKSLGLQELMAGSRAPGLRSVLCDLTLLAYHLAICHFTGGEADLPVCEEILAKQLERYPDGVWFLLFKGRLQLLRGAYTPAEVTYNRCIDSQDMWKQFRHVCYWEIMWLNGLKMDWREASFYACKLMAESGWSRTIYSYSRAAMMLQMNEDLTAVERDTCEDLMRRCALYKQRIAGKSLPMEKFMIRRSARFLAQGGRLVLPGVEMLCLWNMFAILARNDRAKHNMLKLIETTRAEYGRGAAPWEGPYAPDNRALLAYLHGCCLAAMDLPRMALEVLDNVFEYKNDLKEDTFLLPYTVAEIAMCHYKLGDKERALIMLHDARKKFSGYSLESRLHFRLHSKMEIVKNAGKPDPKECSSSSK